MKFRYAPSGKLDLQELYNIKSATDTDKDYELEYIIPKKPFDGLTVLLHADVAPDGRGTGLFIYYDGIWNRVMVGGNTVFAAYGGMSVSAQISFFDLGATWQKLNIFDQETATTRGITFDLANDTFSVDNSGVYMVNISAVFEHNELNAGRTTYIRLFNETSSTGRSGILVATALNVGGTLINISNIVEIEADAVGDIFSIEIGNGDTYSSVIWNMLNLNINNIGRADNA